MEAWKPSASIVARNALVTAEGDIGIALSAVTKDANDCDECLDWRRRDHPIQGSHCDRHWRMIRQVHAEHAALASAACERVNRAAVRLADAVVAMSKEERCFGCATEPGAEHGGGCPVAAYEQAAGPSKGPRETDDDRKAK